MSRVSICIPVWSTSHSCREEWKLRGCDDTRYICMGSGYLAGFFYESILQIPVVYWDFVSWQFFVSLFWFFFLFCVPLREHHLPGLTGFIEGVFCIYFCLACEKHFLEKYRRFFWVSACNCWNTRVQGARSIFKFVMFICLLHTYFYSPVNSYLFPRII